MPFWINIEFYCFKVTLEVLERVLAEIDERLDGRHPRTIFQRIYTQVSHSADTLRQLHEVHERDGYVRIRKVCPLSNHFYILVLQF